MKIGLRKLHSFIVNELPSKVLKHYWRFEILNESDLQFFVMLYLRRYINKDGEHGRLEIHGCLSCVDGESRVRYPDVVIMHRGTPWAIIELKESRAFKKMSAEREREKIRAFRDSRPDLRRGYLFHLGCWGKKRALTGPKQSDGFWFFEIPVVLERVGVSETEIEDFQKNFKKKRRFALASAG